MKYITLLSALLLVAAEPIASKDFQEKVLEKENRLVAVSYGAVWCPPCVQLKPIYKKCSELNRDVDFYLFDIDSDMNLARNQEIAVIPTIIFYRNGKVVNRHVGSISAEKLNDIVKSLKETKPQ